MANDAINMQYHPVDNYTPLFYWSFTSCYIEKTIHPDGTITFTKDVVPIDLLTLKANLNQTMTALDSRISKCKGIIYMLSILTTLFVAVIGIALGGSDKTTTISVIVIGSINAVSGLLTAIATYWLTDYYTYKKEAEVIRNETNGL